MDALAFHQKTLKDIILSKRIKYDYKKTNQIGEKTYLIEIYRHKEFLNLKSQIMTKNYCILIIFIISNKI